MQSYIIFFIYYYGGIVKLFNYLNRYIVDEEFRVIVMKDYINVINYDEILDFSNNEISIKYDSGIMIIKGKDLVVSKMLDDELLIKGQVKSISYGDK